MPACSTRPATVHDAPAIAAVQVASWQAAYSHLLPQAWLQAMSVSQRAAQWAGFIDQQASEITVALQGDRVVGFASAGPARDRDAPARTHELYALYVHPQHWSAGHGWRLWQAVERAARQAGAERCTLWAIVGNARGIRFYERLGFCVEPGSRQRFEIDGTPLDEDRHVRPIGPAPEG